MRTSLNVIYRSPIVSIEDIAFDESAGGIVMHSLGSGSLVFVRSGVFLLRGGHDTVIIDANYASFGNEGDRLSAAPAFNGACACTLIRYDRSAFKDIPLRPYGSVLCTPRAYLMHARLLNEAWLGRPDTLVEQQARELLLETLGAAKTARPANFKHERTVNVIKELINGSLSDPVPLPQVASVLYLSPFTVSRLFHRETGVSLRRYMQRLRLRAALSLMLDGSRRLSDIAIDLGFYDESHFSKAFHAEFGSAPALALGSTCNRAK